MSNRKCDRWLKLGGTDCDIFLVESLKFEQYQFAQVLVTRESTQSNQFTRVIVLVLALACWMELASAHTREHTRARVELALNLYHR